MMKMTLVILILEVIDTIMQILTQKRGVLLKIPWRMLLCSDPSALAVQGRYRNVISRDCKHPFRFGQVILTLFPWTCCIGCCCVFVHS